jgi:hypothetical protein
VNFRLTETDLRAIFAHAGMRLVVTQGEFADLVRCLGSELGFGVMLADQDYVQAVGSGATSPPRSRLKTAGSADALIQYTSGAGRHGLLPEEKLSPRSTATRDGPGPRSGSGSGDRNHGNAPSSLS